MKHLYLLLLLLISCANKNKCDYLYNYDHTFCLELKSNIVIDSDFSNEEIDLIKESLYNWSYATGGNIKLIFSSIREHNYLLEYEYPLNSILSPYLWIIKSKPGETEFDPSVVGRYTDGKIFLLTRKFNQEYYKEYFKTVLTHELGHAIGLEHSPQNYSLMGPNVSENICIFEKALPTKIDIKNLRKLYCVE